MKPRKCSLADITNDATIDATMAKPASSPSVSYETEWWSWCGRHAAVIGTSFQ
jgi:hypothetical protein